MIQFFNIQGMYCSGIAGGTDDGFIPGSGTNLYCERHSSDFAAPAWKINLAELLRLVQFFNVGGYHACLDAATEDGFCAGRSL